MLDMVQVWQPDTCGCLVHQAGDQDAPNGERAMRYVTHAQAVQVHLAHFLARPQSTQRHIWGPFSIPAWLRWRPVLKLLIQRLQPAARLCPAHLVLGYTGEMYETVRELNIRKNIACYLAWMVGNEVSDEDLQWVALGALEPILVAGRVSTERMERMKSLSRVFPPDAVIWKVDDPTGAVHLKYLRDWCSRELADAIQEICDARFSAGRVAVL